MIDLAKISCKLHPNEYINLFCAQNSCRTGLCPTCVCQHTQMHVSRRSQPIYQNIRSTYTRVHEEISSQLDVVKQDKIRLNALFDSIRVKKQKLKETLELAKQDCVKTVVEFFGQLEKKWEADLIMEEKKNCLHNNYRLQTLSQLLHKQVEKLIGQSKKMNSYEFFEKVQLLEKEILIESQEFHKKFSQQLDQNQQYRPSIIYFKGNLEELKAPLGKILKLQYNIPIERLLNYTWNNSQEKRMVSSCSNWRLKDYPVLKTQQSAQTKESFNLSTIIQRVNTDKPILQGKLMQSNSSLFIGVPRVLTTSAMQSFSTPMSPKIVQSFSPNPNISVLRSINESLQKRKEKVKINNPAVNEVVSTRFQKCERAMSNKSALKAKKGGLSLSVPQSQSENVLVNKENKKT